MIGGVLMKSRSLRTDTDTRRMSREQASDHLQSKERGLEQILP